MKRLLDDFSRWLLFWTAVYYVCHAGYAGLLPEWTALPAILLAACYGGSLTFRLLTGRTRP